MMKNGTRKKIIKIARPGSPDLRAEVEKRAYEIWLNEGCLHGKGLDHWLRAEYELAGPQSGTQKEASA